MLTEKQSRLQQHLAALITDHRKSEIERVLDLRTRHLTIVLEDIYQPQNASAVIRSCDCFGIQDLHVIEHTRRFRPNSAVTMGANKWVDIHRYGADHEEPTRACLSRLRERGYRIAALTLREPGHPLHQLDLSLPTALCIGTEKEGLSDTAHELADIHVHIPMFGFTPSFNLSVTAAICLYELTARLHASTLPWTLDPDDREHLRFTWYQRIVTHPEIHQAYLEHPPTPYHPSIIHPDDRQNGL